ncbi:MAG: hypothetical protein QXL52_03525 [Nitrososphaerales archaeon]
MGILNKIKSWFFRTPSLPITPSVSETSPTSPLKVKIESLSSSLNTSIVNEASSQRIMEENKEQILKTENPVQTIEINREEKPINDSVQPMIIQNENIPYQDSVIPISTQSDTIQTLATQQESTFSQIVLKNQNDSIQPSDIQPSSIQPIQHEDTLSQNVQPIQPEMKIKKSRRTRSNCSRRPRKKLKESANSGN